MPRKSDPDAALDSLVTDTLDRLEKALTEITTAEPLVGTPALQRNRAVVESLIIALGKSVHIRLSALQSIKIEPVPSPAESALQTRSQPMSADSPPVEPKPKQTGVIVGASGTKYREDFRCDRCGDEGRTFPHELAGHTLWTHSWCRPPSSVDGFSKHARQRLGLDQSSSASSEQQQPRPQLLRVADDWEDDAPGLEELLRAGKAEASGEPSPPRKPLVSGKPPGGEYRGDNDE
jgi:hypothetical protein